MESFTRYLFPSRTEIDCSEFIPESIVSAGEKALVFRPIYKGRKIDCQIGFSALYHVLPESCIQQTVHQARSPATHVSSCHTSLPPAILLGDAMDGRKHEST